MHCAKVEAVDLPALAEMPDYLFAGCIGLRTVKCHTSRRIGAYAFSGCTMLDSAIFPKMYFIAPGAFGATPDNTYGKCQFLSRLSLGARPPVYGDTENHEGFAGDQASNQLVLVGVDGSPLQGGEYEQADSRYREDVGWDGNTKQWRWWYLGKRYLLEFEVEPVNGKTNGALICSGGIETGTTVAEGLELQFTAQPDAGFRVDK